MNNKLINLVIILAVGVFLFFEGIGKQNFAYGQGNDSGKQKVRVGLSHVKIASLYENITDVDAFGRKLEDAVKQFKETQTDFIFRGFWLWSPAFDTPENISSEVLKLAEAEHLGSAQIIKLVKERGYFYKRLANSSAIIKKELLGIIFCGAIPAQKVNGKEYNPVTNKVLTREDTWRKCRHIFRI